MDRETLPAKPNASVEPRVGDRHVERLFERFSAIYGKHWLDMYPTEALADEAQAAWTRGLARYEPAAIARALEHCAQHVKFPPTLPEFATFCRDFRNVAQGGLALPRAARGELPPRIKEAIDKLAAHVQDGTPDGRDWARRILQRHANGESMPTASLHMAQEALAVPVRLPSVEELREADAERRAIQAEDLR